MALEKIQELVGTRYDPEVVNALIRGCKSGEIARGVVKYIAETHSTTDSMAADQFGT